MSKKPKVYVLPVNIKELAEGMTTKELNRFVQQLESLESSEVVLIDIDSFKQVKVDATWELLQKVFSREDDD
jgi:hypothetical protein